VVFHEEYEGGERDEADDDPPALLEGEIRVDAIDHREPDRRQEPGQRQEVGICVREGDPDDDVGSDEEGEEEGGVGKRSRGDDVLPGDVDGRESGRGEEADDEEVEKLPVAEGQGAPSSS
jgi:hypothetical protein